MKDEQLLNTIPEITNYTEIYLLLNKKEITYEYLCCLKRITKINNNKLTDWLNISTRTLRQFVNNEREIDNHTQERIVLILSLIKYGTEKLGSMESFKKWLAKMSSTDTSKNRGDYLCYYSGIYFVHKILEKEIHRGKN